MHYRFLNISGFAPLSKSSRLQCDCDMTGKIWLLYFSSIAFSQKPHEMKHYIDKLSTCLMISLYKWKKENKAEEVVIHGILCSADLLILWVVLLVQGKNHFSILFFKYAAILLQEWDITWKLAIYPAAKSSLVSAVSVWAILKNYTASFSQLFELFLFLICFYLIIRVVVEKRSRWCAGLSCLKNCGNVTMMDPASSFFSFKMFSIISFQPGISKNYY